VESEVGKGTTFQIFLPVATGAVDVHPPSSDPRTRHGTETVLVIEDQEEVRAVIDKTLRQCGYTVIAASDGPQAIITARTHHGPIHLLLTDVVLPTGNGRDVARHVLADRPSVRVLYMSGYAQTAILHEGALEAGLAFIQKPFSGETLAAKVRAVLDVDPSPRY
jgi:CheY-like chemotaxis protein